MVLVCLIVIAALAVCVLSAWQRNRAEAAPQPAARRAAEVIEEGFSGESIAYGRSVMDHPMLEREAAKLCEKIRRIFETVRRYSMRSTGVAFPCIMCRIT